MWWLLGISLFLALSIPFLWWQNNGFAVTNYKVFDSNDIKCEKLKKIECKKGSFKRIVVISDIHSKRLRERFFELISASSPDVIVICGDFVDAKTKNFERDVKCLKRLVSISPVVYVFGNHEKKNKFSLSLEKIFSGCGANIVRNGCFTCNDLCFIGIDDTSFFGGKRFSLCKDGQSEMLRTIKNNMCDGKNILITHRPEYFDLYSKSGVWLTLCGHAHGGQWRIFGRGLVSPGEFLFPKYTSGFYKKGNFGMIVSRGIGNSFFPQRLFNRPEIVVIDVENE